MNIKKTIEIMKNLAFLSGKDSSDKCERAIADSIKALEVVDKIADIIIIEQQSTSCEYTKLKSFEMIEKIISDYQLNR